MVDWLTGWLAGRLVGWLVCWLVGWLVCLLVGWLVWLALIGLVVGWLFRPFGRYRWSFSYRGTVWLDGSAHTETVGW